MVIELAAAGAVGYFVYWAWQRETSPVPRRIRATPRFTVATVPAVTQARLAGTARALDGATITAPLTGRPCVCYVARMHVSEPSALGGPGARDERELNREPGGVRFELVDDSGAAIVDPDAAELALRMTKVPESDRTSAFVDKYKYQGNGRVDFFEGIIAPGQRIAIAGYGERTGGTLVMRSSPRLPLAISDSSRLSR